MKKRLLCLLLTLLMVLSVGCGSSGKTQKTESRLRSLVLSQGELTPEFSPEIFNYTAEVPNDCESIEIFPETAKDVYADIDAPARLSVGENDIVITLSADGSETVHTYTVTVTRLASNDCGLSTLYIKDGTELTPEFSEDVFSYEAEIGYGIDELEFKCIANEPDAKISISGNSDFKEGENTVTISVTSPSGIYSRDYVITVTKTNDRTYWQKAVDEGTDKFLAITFDDGPSKFTPKLLDILDKHNIKATFFVVGNRVDNFPKTLKDAFDRGHEIGNHSWDHTHMRSDMSDDAKWSNINKCNKAVKEITGTSPTSFRPPGGIWVRSVKQFHDMDVVYWNVDPEDWKHKDTEIVQQNIMDQVDNYSIILLHDLYETSVDAADIVIGKLKDEGYTFVRVDELLKIKAYKKSLSE